MADKRQKKKRESSGAYWMDTYGDMVTLLLTFFIMMFASSSMNQSKWIRIVESFTGEPAASVVEPIDPLNPTAGFAPTDYIPKVTPRDNTQDGQGQVNEQQTYDENAEEIFNELYEKLRLYIAENDLESTVAVERDGQIIYITILDGILFDSGSAEIRDGLARSLLTELGDLFMDSWEQIYDLRIEGHTDNVPINTPYFKDNRSLSAERANEVWRFMNETSGLPDAANIETVGLGETRPVASNDTAEGKQENRRVEFILESINVLVDEDAGNQ